IRSQKAFKGNPFSARPTGRALNGSGNRPFCFLKINKRHAQRKLQIDNGPRQVENRPSCDSPFPACEGRLSICKKVVLLGKEGPQVKVALYPARNSPLTPTPLLQGERFCSGTVGRPF